MHARSERTEFRKSSFLRAIEPSLAQRISLYYFSVYFAVRKSPFPSPAEDLSLSTWLNQSKPAGDGGPYRDGELIVLFNNSSHTGYEPVLREVE